MIDHKNISLDDLNRLSKNTLAETLDMKVVELGPDFLIMSMPVTSAHHQPMGLLHGGATIALAENAASLAANVFWNGEKSCYGLSVHASHVKSVRDGKVYAKASLRHGGRTTQLWQVDITNEDDQLISDCKVTMMIIDTPSKLMR